MAGKRISTIRIVKTDTWATRTLPGVHENPEIIRYSNDGRYLAVMEVRKDAFSSLKIFDMRTQTPSLVQTITVEQIVDRMDCFAFCPTGDYLVIGWNLGEKLRVYRTSDWSTVTTAFNDSWLERSLINGVKFSHDGRRMYVCATTTHPDGAIAVYDMENWVRLPQYVVPSILSTYWIDVSNTRGQMAVYDGLLLRLINLSTWAIESSIFIGDGEKGYTGVDYNEDGTLVAVTGGSTGAVVYNTTTFTVENDLIEMGVGRGGSAVFDKRPSVAPSFSRSNNPVDDLGLMVYEEYNRFVVRSVNDYTALTQININHVALAHNVPVINLSAFNPSESAISSDGTLVVTTWTGVTSGGGNV